MGIRTREGKIEAYVFERDIRDTRVSGLREGFAAAPGVAFIGQFVGAFSLFGRVLADDLGQLQRRIDGEYFDAGIRSQWSVNLTGDRLAAPKRASPDLCALVQVRTTEDPFEVLGRLDERFGGLPEDRSFGAAVATADDFDVLVDLGADTLEHVIDMVLDLRGVAGVGRTATAVADLADNAIRPMA
jgi:hypothetical protein